MSKISIPFHIDGHPEFRFSLALESNSVEAHSLMDSGDATDKENLTGLLRGGLDDDNLFLMGYLEEKVKKWKESHK